MATTASSTRTPSSSLGSLSGRRRFANGGMTVVVYLAFLLAVIPLVWLTVTVVTRGLDRFFIDANGDSNFNLDLPAAVDARGLRRHARGRHHPRDLGHADSSRWPRPSSRSRSAC